MKFNDADLIGASLRITIGERSIKAGGAEFKRRDKEMKEIVALNEAVERVKKEIKEMTEEIVAHVVTMLITQAPNSFVSEVILRPTTKP